MCYFVLFNRLFNTIDENSDGYLSATELRALIIGIEFEDLNLNEHDAVDEVMMEFDRSHDNRIDMIEFSHGITKWLAEVKRSSKYNHDQRKEMQLISDFHMVNLIAYIYIYKMVLFCF